MFVLICYILAVVLAALAAGGVSAPRISLGWAALAFLALGQALSGGIIR